MKDDQNIQPDNLLDIDTKISSLATEEALIRSQIEEHDRQGNDIRNPQWRRSATVAMIKKRGDIAKLKALRSDIVRQKKADEKEKSKASDKEKRGIHGNLNREIALRRDAERKFQDLHKWAWNTFPERRDEIAKFCADLKARSVSLNLTPQ